ncbi:MAG: TerB family tellurite resistance protein [Alistipes sp.]|nr:TerB family tellurite resistance protein [Alistipes sp.]
MKVTIELLAAIYKIGSCIVTADGQIKREAVSPLTDFYYSINGFNDDAMQMVVDCANNQMSIEQAVELVANMDVDAKQKVVNVYADIVRADGDITENEITMFNGAIKLCGLPQPTTPLVDDPDDVISPTFIIAQTNGLARPFQSEAEDWQQLDADLGEQIDAERLEVVRYTAPLNELSKRVGLVGCHLVFLVDRNGYAKEDIGDNMTGTILYGSGAEIRGDIIFALETDNGYKLKGIESMVLLDNIYCAVNDAVGNLLRLE